jgi:Tfp pilus assembly protein PilF
VAVKGLGVGDVLEYEITLHLHTPLIPGQFWFAYDVDKTNVALDEEVEVSVPRERLVKVKSAELTPVMMETGNRRTYTWKTANHNAKKSDEPRREFPPPSILLSTFQSWEEVGRWWSSLEQPVVAPTAEIRAKAAELTRTATTWDEKVRVLYDYVATRFHYISISFGIGRYQPHPAAEVLKNEYGDCKDKHTLLASLLEAVGIDAYPVLMNSSRHIDPDVPSPGQFDHVVTAVPKLLYGNKLIWLDTTTEVAPFGFLAFALRDKQALVTPGTSSPMLVNTPADPPFKIFRHFEVDAKLSDSGVLEGEMKHTYRDDSELVLRGVFRRVPQSQWKEVVQNIVQGMGYEGEVSQVEVGSLEATNEPFHFTNKYVRKDYPDWANHRITPPVGFVGFMPVKDDEERTQPILLGAPEEITSIARVELPKGYAPRLLPAVDLVRDFAEYHDSYAFKDGIFTAEVRLVVKSIEVPLSKLDDYKSFQKAVNDNQNQYTELSNGSESAYVPTPSANSGAFGLFTTAQQAVQRHDLSEASYSLERALKLDEHYKDAWVLLAAVRMMQGQVNEGTSALRKAIEIDPKDSRTRDMLASTYIQLRQPEDAIRVWRDLLKQDPNNGTAHANLGKVLLDLKRYGEAVPELESAVALSTPSNSVNLPLAKAYLGAGKNEKAAAIFSKAMETESNPATWNDVAYALADHNLNLQDAQRYAEKAVKSVEDEAAQVRLDKLEVADLNRMTQLAAYWGTLGWVYFREGDFAKAQKFLEAAWNLEQDEDVGQHLAQTYENQGNKAAARRQHILASALSPSAGLGAPPVLRHRDVHGTSGVQEKLPFEEVQDMRRTKLGRLSSKPGSAEFFVLVAPGGTIEDVKFISGAEQLRPLSKAVASLKLKAPLPDEAPVKLVRRGVLVCESGNLGCDFTLFTVDSVNSIE